MSKSLGNYFTLRDLLEKGFTGREIRFLLLSSHYRESFNFTLDGLAGARTALNRIDELLVKLKELAGTTNSAPNPALANEMSASSTLDCRLSALTASCARA